MSLEPKTTYSTLLEHMGVDERKNGFYLKNHGKSFYLARLFLSRSVAKKSQDLYAFCRVLDDLVDINHDDLTQKESINTLNSLKNKINKESQQGHIALSTRLTVTAKPILDLLDGMYHDLNGNQVKDLSLLKRYSYQVAGTVGLLMCDVLGINDQKARTHAVDLGIAMQLTNIARDVEQDAKIGRIYLPYSWLGLESSQDLIDPTYNARNKIIFAIKKTLKVSEDYYQKGFAGLKYIPFRERLSIFIAGCLYREISSKVKKNNYYKPGVRAFVPFLEKISLTLSKIKVFIKTFGLKNLKIL